MPSAVELIARIASDPKLRRLLEWPFDFYVPKPSDRGDELNAGEFVEQRIEAPDAFDLVATDGSGGWFAVGQETGQVLYLSSEGQAGVLAANLRVLLALLAAAPSWHDLVTPARSGDRESFEAVRESTYAELAEEDPDVPRAQEALRSSLGLPDVDPFNVLTRALALGAEVRVFGPDGTPYEDL